MTQSICPDCGTTLDGTSPKCPECSIVIDRIEERGQSHTLATVVFIILVIGILFAIGIVIVMILR